MGEPFGQGLGWLGEWVGKGPSTPALEGYTRGVSISPISVAWL